jgi:hypothetical protein
VGSLYGVFQVKWVVPVMDQKEVLKLLSRLESETLEFKHEGYLLDHGDGKIKYRQRDD